MYEITIPKITRLERLQLLFRKKHTSVDVSNGQATKIVCKFMKGKMYVLSIEHFNTIKE